MDEVELVLCTHCKKEVAKANYDLHEPHCKRFLCICPDCDETVPRDLLEQHNTEQHTEVKCKMCNKKMEQRHLLDHEKDECSERPQICEFCQLELPLSNLKEHEVSCGSRTERCSDCGRYIKLMDQIDHAQICSTNTPTTSKDLVPEDDTSDTDEQTMLQCQNCLKYIPSDKLKEHKMLCTQSLRFIDVKDDDSEEEDENHSPGNDSTPDAADFSFSSLQKVKRDRNIGMGLDKISTCPLCHLALPVKTLEWHEKKCELHRHLSMA
ncbi:XIAP-associated factor 1-like [Carassius auratus]|uniref:XIAP-associated factor 1-like n=1 Tax=Carassius auratus TaxID=7957 RepID=A0A6P6QWF3_CARAU|nr:XIAP-associated factor 1-like [Carassius auratus]